MATPSITTLKSKPGVKRDGTEFEGDNYIDAQWCRFQRGLPRKIAGYRLTTNRLDEKVYGMNSFSADLINYLALGMNTKLVQASVDAVTGNLSALVDRTPAGFTADPNNSWQFSNLPSGVATAVDLIANGAPNLADIASTVARPIYYGQADLATALLASGLDPVSGGVTTLGPYVFGYGTGGFINWSKPGDPTAQENLARVTGQKIVYGRPLRGAGGGPSGLFWSLDALVRGVFNPAADPTTDPVFQFDELATELSILGARSVVEYNGVFYWWDNSGPLMFNGVVQEVPNDLNINFLLDNINYTWRNKMFAMKIARWGEIWWCFPFGNSTECNYAVIYNVRERTWYDTALPGNGRTSGIFAQVYPRPFMTDADLTSTGYSLWQHETGVNKIAGTQIEPIPSSFTTADLTLLTGDQPLDKGLRVAIVEPDFIQVGDLTCQVSGKANARAPMIDSDLMTFPPDNGSLTAADQVVRFSENRRQMRFRWTSNVLDGDYQMGQIIIHIEPTDGRITT